MPIDVRISKWKGVQFHAKLVDRMAERTLMTYTLEEDGTKVISRVNLSAEQFEERRELFEEAVDMIVSIFPEGEYLWKK